MKHIWLCIACICAIGNAEDSLFEVERATASLSELDTTAFDLALKLNVASTFQTPVFIEVFIRADGTAKACAFRLNGMSGYDLGEPDLFYEREVPAGLTNELRAYFRLAEFWNQEIEDPKQVLDGTWHTIEAKTKDKIHKIKRYNPSRTRLTREGEEFIFRIRALSAAIIDTVGIAPYTPKP